jgi:hypothetical protein
VLGISQVSQSRRLISNEAWIGGLREVHICLFSHRAQYLNLRWGKWLVARAHPEWNDSRI